MNHQKQLLSKEQLKREIRRFFQDQDRGISIPLFAELTGFNPQYLRAIFLYGKEELSETVQLRVNKAYAEWKAGNVRVMKRPDNTRYVDYRRESKPVFMPSMGLKVTSEGIKLRVGLRNRHDYSEDSLDDKLRG